MHKMAAFKRLRPTSCEFCQISFFSFFLSRDEISSLQRRVNNKRRFAIDRDDFIPGRISSRDDISRNNTLLVTI